MLVQIVFIMGDFNTDVSSLLDVGGGGVDIVGFLVCYTCCDTV